MSVGRDDLRRREWHKVGATKEWHKVGATKAACVDATKAACVDATTAAYVDADKITKAAYVDVAGITLTKCGRTMMMRDTQTNFFFKTVKEDIMYRAISANDAVQNRTMTLSTSSKV